MTVLALYQQFKKLVMMPGYAGQLHAAVSCLHIVKQRNYLKLECRAGSVRIVSGHKKVLVFIAHQSLPAS